jgi:basic membrane lipoprotein Med (substrate-binding protein (PBP1-ABC) superfamily)
MIDTGVDVVAPMANAAALGVLQAAEESGKAYSIGSSIGQEKNAPKSLIIGIGKDTSIAYESAYKLFVDGKLGKDVIRMGAADGVVFLSDWYDGASGISADIKAKVKTIYDDLAAGKITINLN